jgi:hypothetical protein
MQSRRYEIPLDAIKMTLLVTVYADRSVELEHRSGGVVERYGEHLQTRYNAAETLSIARGMGYPITRYRI